ncbi:kinase-like domain-containing protein [Diplogelasinospora grovesii]|uniref:Kinase-like domain-containing protein n=1 Tax=Diplogelasinospora grovesii TaxID=303347 RepID=A0AAN6NHZ5_9PEZI|nr:kinase-like domain-containing protein [Diplogelasinospora grovesii]
METTATAFSRRATLQPDRSLSSLRSKQCIRKAPNFNFYASVPIWGDDAESIVFAQAFGKGRTIVFRFSLDSNDGDVLPPCSPQASFPDRPSMRAALWSAVASVWHECSELPDAGDPDTVVDIFSYGSWKIYHETLFNNYVDLLLPLDEFSVQHPIEAIGFKRAWYDAISLGGRGCTTLVHHASDPGHKLVFKGIDFRTFLDTYESGHAQEEVMIFKRSTELASNMPRHPNILLPPRTFVTVSRPAANTPVVCGSLYPFYPNGSLAGKIEESNAAGKRIPLLLKAKWCHQMAAALAHTHFVARTYHMDVKPGNFILDEDSNLVLIDWEQFDASVTTAAPEIDGTWDAEEVQVQAADGTSSKALRYTKYQGPERRNMPDTTPGDNGWNQEDCPKASKLDEVFSLGRSMWMLLRQCDKDGFEGIENTEDIVEDWTSSDDIPSDWKEAVEGCLKRDPNDRTSLQDIYDFLEAAFEAFE